MPEKELSWCYCPLTLTSSEQDKTAEAVFQEVTYSPGRSIFISLLGVPLCTASQLDHIWYSLKRCTFSGKTD